MTNRYRDLQLPKCDCGKCYNCLSRSLVQNAGGGGLHGKSASRSETPSRKSRSEALAAKGYDQSPERPASARFAASEIKKVRGVSEHLQEDQNNYVQRRREVEEREKLQMMAELEYQNSQRERFLRASLNGKEFTDLMMRNDQFQQKQQEKLAKIQREIKESEEARIREIRQRLQTHLNNPIPSGDVTWEQMKREEEVLRRSRAEARKQELMANAAHPFPESYEVAVRKAQRAREEEWQRRSFLSMRGSTSSDGGNGMASFGAKKSSSSVPSSPRVRDSKSATKPIPQVVAMEKRLAEQMLRRKLREEAQERKEEEEKKRKLQAERKRIAKIMSIKVPQNSTKVAEKRRLNVEEKAKADKMAAERKLQGDEAKRKREKEIAAVLKTMIQMNEEDRKAKYSGFVELTSAESRAKQTQEDYRAKLRENEARIRAVVEKRPSLLERHDQLVAEQAANANAMKKLAYATSSLGKGYRGGVAGRGAGGGSGRGGGKVRGAKGMRADDESDDYNDDDMFGEEEKAIMKNRRESKRGD